MNSWLGRHVLALLAILLQLGSSAGAACAAGLLVERVEAGSNAAVAGVEPGDVLLTLEDKPLLSPATLTAREQNTFGDRPLRLRLVREGIPSVVQIPSEPSGIVASLPLPDQARFPYVEAWSALNEGKLDQALQHTRTCAAAAAGAGPDIAAWVWWSQGFRFVRAERPKEALLCFGAASGLLQKSKDLSARVLVLMGSGAVALVTANYASARISYGKAVPLAESAALPRWTADALNNLGEAARNEGRLSEAEQCYVRSLAIKRRLVPGSRSFAGTLNNLGGIKLFQGDLPVAARYFREALTVVERSAPGSPEDALLRNNLGLIAYEQKELAAARSYYEAARGIYRELAPGSLEEARVLANLANVGYADGDLTAAAQYLMQAREIIDLTAPRSLEMATALANEANLRYRSGDAAAARGLHERARALRALLAPGSLDLAMSLNNIGFLDLSERRFDDAKRRFREAVAIVNTQRGYVGSTSARTFITERHESEYSGLVRACVATGDLGGAFLALEGARARTLADMLLERRADLAIDLPSVLRQREVLLERQRSAFYARLARLDSGSDAEKVALTYRKLADLNVEHRRLQAELRLASPRYAALRYPNPVGLQEARRMLEPGTVLLYYGVDEDRSYLFALTATCSRLYPLSVGRDVLASQVQRFWSAVSRPAGRYRQDARALYALLIEPAQEFVNSSQRVLICPDGPLRQLPFAALIRERGPGGAAPATARERHLIELTPLHQIVSMSVYREVRRLARQSAPAAALDLVAFGDPLYRKPGGSGAGAASGEGTLPPLFYTREQVQQIGKLFPKRAVYLDRAATETQVKAMAGRARMLHFACHGKLDAKDADAAAVVVTAGTGGEDGWLRAYEVMKLKLNADLVMLSACETGRGEESRSEGILGMTRAFQYAGAGNVGVSLWEIRDREPTALMLRFYRELRQKVPADEALRRAQCSYLQSERTAHPYYWSAFFIAGHGR